MRVNPPPTNIEAWVFDDWQWFQKNPVRNFRLRLPFPGEVWEHCGPQFATRLPDHLKVFCIVQKPRVDAGPCFRIVAVPEPIEDDDNLLAVISLPARIAWLTNAAPSTVVTRKENVITEHQARTLATGTSGMTVIPVK